MAAALAVALAAHALVLFAFELPEAGRAADRVRVTLSVASGSPATPTDVGAAADQAGDDTESRRRNAAVSAGTARGSTIGKTTGRTSGRDDDTARLARPGEGSSSGRTERPRSGAAVPGRSGGRGHASERVRSARADPRAAYVAGWKQRVEAAGTRNFPSGVLRAGTGNHLTVKVTLQSDGRLADARIVRSSGNNGLDNAALRILDDAGPYAPFPPELRQDEGSLTFAYVWRFVAGGEAQLSPQ